MQGLDPETLQRGGPYHIVRVPLLAQESLGGGERPVRTDENISFASASVGCFGQSSTNVERFLVPGEEVQVSDDSTRDPVSLLTRSLPLV